jgi:hypothetical protein
MLTRSDYHDTVRPTVEHDEESGVYSFNYDWSELSPSTAIMEAVSAIDGSNPVDLEPLDGVTNPDGIDAIFTAARGGDDDLELSLRYASAKVTVRQDGTVLVSPVADE